MDNPKVVAIGAGAMGGALAGALACGGADLTIVPSVGGKITPDLTPRMIETARELAADPDVYWTDQLNNADSLVGYYEVGVELLAQMDRPIDVFCCAVGTAGMATGVKNALNDDVNVVGFCA